MTDAVRMHIRLPKDVRTWLEMLATQNERSLNWQVVAVLREHMNANNTVTAKPDAKAQ